ICKWYDRSGCVVHADQKQRAPGLPDPLRCGWGKARVILGVLVTFRNLRKQAYARLALACSLPLEAGPRQATGECK
ncbi:MAG: hypothetical protein M3Z24_17450, partial [Chloroflexota bacterium]|nr:hypothetical protein [Chloroflexota bacterium]